MGRGFLFMEVVSTRVVGLSAAMGKIWSITPAGPEVEPESHWQSPSPPDHRENVVSFPATIQITRRQNEFRQRLTGTFLRCFWNKIDFLFLLSCEEKASCLGFVLERQALW